MNPTLCDMARARANIARAAWQNTPRWRVRKRRKLWGTYEVALFTLRRVEAVEAGRPIPSLRELL